MTKLLDIVGNLEEAAAKLRAFYCEHHESRAREKALREAAKRVVGAIEDKHPDDWGTALLDPPHGQVCAIEALRRALRRTMESG